MARRKKVIDDRYEIKCQTGRGLLRVEAWQDESDCIVDFNLAFINHLLFQKDNGRVLGYDTAHEHWHRHYWGEVKRIDQTSFEELAAQFFEEVHLICRKGKWL